jgi:hypothetical protein
MEIKTCSKCHIEKEITEFHKNKATKDGFNSICKKCAIEKTRKYGIEHPEKLKENKKREYIKNIKKYNVSNKKYQEEHKEEIKINKKCYYEINREDFKEKSKIYYENNKNSQLKKCVEYVKKNLEKTRDYQKKYRKENWGKLSEYRRTHNREKYNNDPIYKVQRCIRHRVNEFFKSVNTKKSNKTMTIVGCTPIELKNHIEKQFKEGMSWENYGFYGWHVDHIIPMSSAKTIEEIEKVSHFTNLQPLWRDENLKKGNKIFTETNII